MAVLSVAHRKKHRGKPELTWIVDGSPRNVVSAVRHVNSGKGRMPCVGGSTGNASRIAPGPQR